MRILIAEDDSRLLKSLLHIFRLHHFAVDGVDNGTDALEYATQGAYDALVLDIMMPGMDGIAVLRALRSQGISTPALFLSARGEIAQRVEGLDAGADDYLSKPFATDELLARVRAMLRRRHTFQPDLVTFGGVSLNRATYELNCGGSTTPLSGKEFQLLEVLLSNPRMVLSTEQLITKIWGFEDVDSSVVWVHISNLRKKLTALGAPVRIRFVRGAGYVLEEAV